MARKQSAIDQLNNDLGDLFRQPAFRRVLREMLRPWDIITQTSYGGDAREAAFMEGRRSVRLDQMAILDQYDPYAFLTLLKEDTDARPDRDARDPGAD